MAQTTPQAPSQEAVQKAWHGWETFVRFSAISIVATALVTALVIAILTR
jgi:hypothetical protein